MKTNKLLAGASMLGALVLWGSCDNPYDLDEKLPPDFGTTLMTYLEEGNYKNYSQLVRDLDYVDALSGVALKTLFVADDEAFERFYASNTWGVKSYDDLSLAQKKMLLYSSMLDNSLQIMNLSSTTGNNGVVVGNAMRRSTAQSVYDTVPVITPDMMPDNAPGWKYYRESGKSIVCMKDMSTVPMTFLVEKFLTNNRITNDDVNKMFNGKIDRQAGETFVNGIKVAEGNTRSANGFVHRMEDVLVPLDNMAEMLLHKSQTQTYSRFIERFSAPYYAGYDVTKNYNYEYGTDVDSVFVKRYFSNRSSDSSVGSDVALSNMPGISGNRVDAGKAVEATLKFDPGWNSFFTDDPNAVSVTVAMQKNMGVMLVPSDKALEEYWNNGIGRVLKDNYGSWDNVPDHVLVKLINNNMLNSWTASVPSKFKDITNSTQDKMGIEPQDVDSVWVACNGFIYLTNKVFSPTEYVSVSFPALVNDNMSIFNWAIEQYQYGSYLNSIDSYYSLFIPTNDALLEYIDPESFGSTETKIWRFHYKADAQNEDDRVWASVFAYDLETGIVGDSLTSYGEIKGSSNLKSRLIDILDNHIVVGNIESGKEYYRTKNGGVVRVKSQGGVPVSVSSSLQLDKDQPINIAEIYDQSVDGNGKTYIINDQALLTTNHSVVDVLDSNPEFSIFSELLQGSELFQLARKGYSSTGTQSGNIASFNNYHYTVYVPNNASMQKAIDEGRIMTWQKLAEMEESGQIPAEGVADEKKKINAFLRYHIQDNSLYIGMDYTNEGGSNTFTRNYETSIMNDETQKFYTLKVNMQEDGITLTDLKGNVRKVVTANGYYNIPAREYWFGGAAMLYPFAVIHEIDGPLFFE